MSLRFALLWAWIRSLFAPLPAAPPTPEPPSEPIVHRVESIGLKKLREASKKARRPALDFDDPEFQPKELREASPRWERISTARLGHGTVEVALGEPLLPQPEPTGPDATTYPALVPDPINVATPSASSSAQTLGTWLGRGQGQFQGLPVTVRYDDSGSALGTPGLPWQMGYLQLEQNPDLTPVLARGQWSDPGEYWGLRTCPPAQERLAEILTALASIPWRLEPPEPPEPTSDPELDKVKQVQYASALAYQLQTWKRWTAPGLEYGLSHWIADVAQWSCVCGFYLGELHWKRGEPQIPSPRAPWTVYQWVLQGETPVGVVQGLVQTDAWGSVPAQRVLIPWSRLVHVARLKAGPSDLEGTSLLRGAYAYLKAYQDLHQLQMVSAALNSAGTWVVTQDPDTPATQAQVEEILTHLATYEASHMPALVLPPGLDCKLEAPGDGLVVDLTAQIALMERAAARAMSGGHSLIALQQHGSFAARESASGDARDQLDASALLVAQAIERTLRLYTEARFGAGAAVCRAAWGQVEQRDQGKYVDTLTKYLQIRDRLWPAARAVLDEALDLPTQEADTGAIQDEASVGAGDPSPQVDNRPRFVAVQ